MLSAVTCAEILYCEYGGCIYIVSTVDVFILWVLWIYLYCECCGCIYIV